MGKGFDAQFALQVPAKPSRFTIANLLGKYGFVNRRAVKRPFLTARHKATRMLFARQYLRYSAANWQNIIFSDEKIFRCRPGGMVRVWKQVSDSKFIAKYVNTTQQKPEGMLVVKYPLLCAYT